MDVVRRGDYYTGYVWTIAFLTPFGYVEPIRVDTSDVEVSALILVVTSCCGSVISDCEKIVGDCCVRAI